MKDNKENDKKNKYKFNMQNELDLPIELQEIKETDQIIDYNDDIDYDIEVTEVDNNSYELENSGSNDIAYEIEEEINRRCVDLNCIHDDFQHDCCVNDKYDFDNQECEDYPVCCNKNCECIEYGSEVENVCDNQNYEEKGGCCNKNCECIEYGSEEENVCGNQECYGYPVCCNKNCDGFEYNNTNLKEDCCDDKYFLYSEIDKKCTNEDCCNKNINKCEYVNKRDIFQKEDEILDGYEIMELNDKKLNRLNDKMDKFYFYLGDELKCFETMENSAETDNENSITSDDEYYLNHHDKDISTDTSFFDEDSDF